jgi:hypothetical protein
MIFHFFCYTADTMIDRIQFTAVRMAFLALSHTRVCRLLEQQRTLGGTGLGGLGRK